MVSFGCAPVEHMANNPVASLTSTLISAAACAPQCATPATTCRTLRPQDQPVTEHHLHLESSNRHIV